MKKNRLLYEPPFAKDLSANILSGQISPQGICQNGTTPYQYCQTGLTPDTTCSPGTIPGLDPVCKWGNYPGGPTCNPTGSAAFSVCYAGSTQA